MKDLIDFYDDSAEYWANTWYENDKLLPYLKRFIKYLNKDNPFILDLCCGAGYESMRLRKLGAKVVGIDLSKKSLEIAKQKNPNIQFYQKDMLKSYLDLGYFDGISCIAGLIHLHNNELNIAFSNMCEVLNKGGYVFIVIVEGGVNKETSQYNGQIYNRNYIYHNKAELIEYSKGLLEFVEELPEIDNWHYYIFKKI